MSRRRITLHIDRVTLSEGRLSREDLAASIERELGPLLQQRGVALRDSGPLSLGRIEAERIQGQGSEAKLGRAVAQAAYGAIKR